MLLHVACVFEAPLGTLCQNALSQRHLIQVLTHLPLGVYLHAPDMTHRMTHLMMCLMTDLSQRHLSQSTHLPLMVHLRSHT